MKKNKEVTLTLTFKSEMSRGNFTAWYLDGGGEQISKYYVDDKWTKDKWNLSADPDSCPKCEFSDCDYIN